LIVLEPSKHTLAHLYVFVIDVRSGSATNVLDLQSGTARAAVVTSAKRQPHVSCMAIDASNDWLVRLPHQKILIIIKASPWGFLWYTHNDELCAMNFLLFGVGCW